MGYRKVNPPRIVNFYSFSVVCKLHTQGENWERNCLSKSKIKQERGLCSPTNCPLAYSADVNDLKKYSEGIYSEEDPDDYSVLYRDVTANKTSREKA